jgi:tungstate transport system ATP-binding protein
MTPLVEIRDLRVVRSRRLVLEVGKLDIEKGEVLALVGPNGAGKTTLLLVLARLLKPERGKILVNGHSIHSMPDLEYRRRVGLVFQEPLLLATSVFENIAIGLRFRHLPLPEIESRVQDWGSRMGIQPLMRRKASTLSGGEAQRVALARAFVLQPDLLLLDEPFGSLDKNTRQDLIHDLKTLLPASGATTLFSTHDEREVNTLAGRSLELLEGRINNGG